VLLPAGKIDAGAISAEESGFGDRHLFAFKRAGDAHDGNHDIGVLCRGNASGEGASLTLVQISCACGLPFMLP
jgi:hypothetical protein